MLFRSDSYQLNTRTVQGEPPCTHKLNEQKPPLLNKAQDRHKPFQPVAGTCFNCGKMGHFAVECTKPQQRQDHLRAARTVVLCEQPEPNHESGGEDNAPSPQENKYGPYDSDVKEIEVDVYDNKYYSRSTDKEHMA